MAKKVMIVCTDGTTFEGILGWTWKDCLKLKSVTIHSRDESVPIDGIMEIYPYQILWVQQLGNVEGT